MGDMEEKEVLEEMGDMEGGEVLVVIVAVQVHGKKAYTLEEKATNMVAK